MAKLIQNAIFAREIQTDPLFPLLRVFCLKYNSRTRLSILLFLSPYFFFNLFATDFEYKKKKIAKQSRNDPVDSKTTKTNSKLDKHFSICWTVFVYSNLDFLEFSVNFEQNMILSLPFNMMSANFLKNSR